MTITIPVWLLWLVGVPLGLAIISLAILGLMYINFMRGFGRR